MTYKLDIKSRETIVFITLSQTLDAIKFKTELIKYFNCSTEFTGF